MISAQALLMLAMGITAAEPTANDYGRLHYLYAGAIGDQGCADRSGNGLRKRRFEAHYAARVRVADDWFEAHYAKAALADARAEAYGGPDAIDVRDYLMTSNGEPLFRDTALFVINLRSIEHGMRSAP